MNANTEKNAPEAPWHPTTTVFRGFPDRDCKYAPIESMEEVLSRIEQGTNTNPQGEAAACLPLALKAVNEHAALVRVEQVLRECSYALAEAGKCFAIANPNAKRPNLYELHAANGFGALESLAQLRAGTEGGK